MIKNLLFDFGDVFINLDKKATSKALSTYGVRKIPESIKQSHLAYETGSITTETFIQKHLDWIPELTDTSFVKVWNSILLDFPEYRLEFIQKLAQQKQFRLFLLSNTNELHIEWIQKHVPFFKKFHTCFEGFYLSHEIGLRKPNFAIFEWVLQRHQLLPEQTLFIDDTKENTDAAKALGLKVWNNDPTKDDITELFTIHNHLF